MPPIDGVRVGKRTVTFLDADNNFLTAVLIDQIETVDISYSTNSNLATYSLLVTLKSGTTKKLSRKRRATGRVPELERKLQEIAEEVVQAVDEIEN